LYIGQMFKISLNASSHELPLLYWRIRKDLYLII
jgi:hypothetical protein